MLLLLGCAGPLLDPVAGLARHARGAPPPFDTGDADGDGYTTDDCDDGDATVYPGAAESCSDGVDQDCDGSDVRCLVGDVSADVDGNAVVLSGLDYSPDVAWVGDVDGDGDGELLVGTFGDHTADIFAGAAWLFTDPIVGEVPTTDAPVAFFGALESDYFGGAVADAGDTDGDGLSDVLIGASGVRSSAYAGGAAYLYTTIAAGTFDPGDATAAFEGQGEQDAAGLVVHGAGDTDGDGFDDLIIGGSVGAGQAYLVRCPCSGTSGLADADIRWTSGGELNGVAFAADLTGDGLPEAVFYDKYVDTVRVVPASGSGDLVLAPESIALIDNPQEEPPGARFAAGDIDGDGNTDLAWGANGVTWIRYTEGVVMVFAGPLSGALGLGDAVVTARGGSAYAGSGADLAIGDLDGDGADDLLVTNPTQVDSSGSARSGSYLLYGPLAGGYQSTDADVAFLGSASLSPSASVELGDLDGDAIPEVILGTDRESDNAVYVVTGGR